MNLFFSQILENVHESYIYSETRPYQPLEISRPVAYRHLMKNWCYFGMIQGVPLWIWIIPKVSLNTPDVQVENSNYLIKEDCGAVIRTIKKVRPPVVGVPSQSAARKQRRLPWAPQYKLFTVTWQKVLPALLLGETRPYPATTRWSHCIMSLRTSLTFRSHCTPKMLRCWQRRLFRELGSLKYPWNAYIKHKK